MDDGRTFAVPFQEAGVVFSGCVSYAINIYTEGLYSLASLHSGAIEADMVVVCNELDGV